MKRNQIIWTVIVVIILGAGIGYYLTYQPIGENKDSIQIGAILPLTGPGSEWGTNTKNGIDVALEELQDSSNLNINVIYKDSQAEPREGVSAARQLIDVNNVQAIIDDAASSVALAVIPIITENKIPMISTGSSSPDLSGSSPYFVRLWISDVEEAMTSARFARNEQNFSTSSILYIQNEYGEGLKNRFKELFTQLGGIVHSELRFAQSETDFRSYATRIENEGSDFVYVVAYPNNIPSLLSAFKTVAPSVDIIGTGAFNNPELIKNVGNAAEGIYFPYPKEPDITNVRENFLKKYSERFNQEPGSPAAEGYDSLILLAEAIRNVGKNPDEIMHYLHTNTFNGASGIINFDENGDVHKPMEFFTVQDGKITKIGEVIAQ